MKKLLLTLIPAFVMAFPNQSGLFGEIGMAAGTYNYKEPGVMDITGIPVGVTASIGLRDGALASLLNAPQMIHRIEGHYFSGKKQRYDGGEADIVTGETSPMRTDSKDDFYQAAYTLGVPLNNTAGAWDMLYIGYGHRYLENMLEGSAAYKREQSYSYIPFGFEGNYRLDKGAVLTLGVEYRILLQGKNKSYMSQVGYERDAHFTQSDGAGYRLFGGVRYDLPRSYIFARLVLEGWSVGDSTTDRLMHLTETRDGQPVVSNLVEPENSTLHLYFNVGIGF